MAELTALELEEKAAAVRAQLAAALARHGRLVYSNSLGAEAVVLTDIIWTHLPQIDMFSIDTGRLYEETYELLEKLQRRYQRAIRVVYPDARALEQLIERQGINGFYHSLEARLEWTETEVWQYIRARRLPYNPLHDRQFPSIGCAPCTRAIQPGESRRAGRWWWEQPETRECGLHPRMTPAAMTPAAV